MSNLRIAFRQLLKNSGLTAVAVLTLALGMAGNTARASEPIAVAAGDRVELIDIGGRKLQLLSRGEGSPTVVIEAGLGEPPVESGSWRAVLDVISRSNRVPILGNLNPNRETSLRSRRV